MNTAGEALHHPSPAMTFTLTGSTKKYGPERLEFIPQTTDKNDPKAVKIVRWVTDASKNWYVIWSGYDFIGNSRILYRDALKQGFTATA